ncbi:hypothetical protein [Cognatishimia sp. MH4019]|uniref:hypothetical protein n=1 Tax=Cognatishimia sp. MH4019 TaxID=2854030 RepID=UPI001CD37713|nr:hypothetical protein [Cognatishimia sp. MH4019]
MQHSILENVSFESFGLQPVLNFRVELGPEDDNRIRLALSEEVGLAYGDYDHVAFETAPGTQFFRGQHGTASGAMQAATRRKVRALMFSIPRDEAILKTALKLIHRLHSYEEPVVYVTEAYATRIRGDQSDKNPNKWWNRNSE